MDAVRGLSEVHGGHPIRAAARRHARPLGRGDSWRDREWTTEITEQQPDEKVAWKTIDGEVKNDGVVSFEQIARDQTRVNVQMDVEGESTAENVAGDLLGVVKSQVRGDLERFKQLIENRDVATGAYRGKVQDGEAE